MAAFLFGILIAITALIVALTLGNIVIFLLLHDAPLLWLFRNASRDVEILREVNYVHGSEHAKHRLDLYRPKGMVQAPVVVFIHGGYWISGNKTLYPPFTDLYANIGTAFARAGVACAVINYRLSPEVRIEGIVSDVTTAIRWVQESAAEIGCNGDEIFVMGHSAGGHLAALLAANQDLLTKNGIRPHGVRGYICMSAMYDLTNMAMAQSDSFNQKVTYAVFGHDPDAMRQWSPSSHFRLGMPPVFMLVGQRDHQYLAEQFISARLKLTELQANPRSFVVPNAAHSDLVLRFGRRRDPILPRVLAFVKNRAA